MNTEFKGNIPLVQAVGRAVSKEIDRFTFGLVLYDDGPDPCPQIGLGSSVGVSVGGRAFLATAAHNVSGRDLHRIAVVHSLTIQRAWIPIVASNSRPDVDRAWAELQVQGELQEKCLLPVERLDGELLERKRYFVHGFPIARAQIQETLPRQTIALTSFGVFTVLHPRMTGDPAVDVYLVYSSSPPRRSWSPANASGAKWA